MSRGRYLFVNVELTLQSIEQPQTSVVIQYAVGKLYSKWVTDVHRHVFVGQEMLRKTHE